VEESTGEKCDIKMGGKWGDKEGREEAQWREIQMM
jgi:hypothetical protein